MTNIRTLITQLDELREKVTKGEWKPTAVLEGTIIGTTDGRPVNWVADAKYIVALHAAYEALRTAALEGEKYKAEHEKLTGFIDELKSLKVYEDESYEIACDNLINKWKV